MFYWVQTGPEVRTYLNYKLAKNDDAISILLVIFISIFCF